MNKPNQLFDDLAQLAGGAIGVASRLQAQISEDLKARVDELAARMDLVPREDFEKLETMIKALQDEVKDQRKMIETLQKSKKK